MHRISVIGRIGAALFVAIMLAAAQAIAADLTIGATEQNSLELAVLRSRERRCHCDVFESDRVRTRSCAFIRNSRLEACSTHSPGRSSCGLASRSTTEHRSPAMMSRFP